ncbi:MAG: DUF4178 domain-containing protein [Deltaproteobacteria bacterium]|nr:DUF4178 domain-containing protein [Deltaproteobacteria bacterium]
MASRVTNCPNCGGQVEFKAGSSLLSVCPYCASAVARVGDDITELEILGKVAPLADLGSPLSLGVSGKYRGRGFTLVGQLQLDYGQGPWNEWYAAFDDGSWGWVAEAQGRAYVTFGKEVPGLPSFAHARVGSRIAVGNKTFAVVERRRAVFKAAQGELPFAVAPGSHFHYADLQGPEGLFGTIDYGTGTDRAEALFLGEQQPYDKLFDRSVLRDVAPGQAAGGVGLNCPNCGASVELRAPDESMRVACGACGSLLGCDKGNDLYLLTSLNRPGPDPVIPLGSVGRFEGKKWTVYGFLVRSVTFEGERYEWSEYLLRGNASEGYRWLVNSDGHWSWVEPIHAGDVLPDGPRGVKFGNERFAHYQSASARVDALRGEFYWKVAIGERVGTADFISPPRMLSRESSADEVNWSIGTYLEADVVAEAFGLQGKLPPTWGVAPHEPNPHKKALKGMFALAGVFSLILLVLAGLMITTSDATEVFKQEWPLVAAPVAAGAPPTQSARGNVIQSQPFQLTERSNLAISVTSDLNSGWLFNTGVITNLNTQKRYPFGAGIDSATPRVQGTTWGQGGRVRTVYLGDMPKGEYVLQLTPEWSSSAQAPTRVSVRLRQDVFVGSHAVVVLILLWLFPMLKVLLYYGFEKRRWADSDHAG